MSASLGGTNNASLWNNPQILSALLPGVNLSAMQQAMQAELNVDAIPLANMSQQLSQLQSQLSAWQALQGDLTNLQADAQTLAGSSLYAGIAATSSDTNVATVTAGGTGSPATYQLTVTNLMSPEIDNSALQSSDSTALNYTGSFSLNGTSISVSSSDTLQTIAQSINAAAAGVTATVLPSSGSYVLNLASTEGQAITWSDPNGILQGLGVLSGAQVPANQVQAAAAARYSINGVSETSVTDADSTSIPGVTVDLVAPGSSTLSVTQNQNAIVAAFQKLASDYNTLIGDVNRYAGKGGVLEGDATVLGVNDTLEQALTATNSALPSGYQSLAQVGVTISAPVGSPDQLSMSVNTAALQTALNGNAADVAMLLNGATAGIAQQLVQQLNTMVGPVGTVPTEVSALQTQISNLSSEINDPTSAVNMRITQQQQALQTEFQNMITALMASQGQGAQIQGFLQAQYGYGSGSTAQGGSSSVL